MKSQAHTSQIEITREIGENNIFLFGNLAEDVNELRHAHVYGDYQLDESLAKVFDEIEKGTFGEAGSFSALVNGIVDHGDFYLVSDDFTSYCKTQELIDKEYQKQQDWVTKCITSVARMGFFSSDRCIDEYAEMIWNIEPIPPQTAETNGVQDSTETS